MTKNLIKYMFAGLVLIGTFSCKKNNVAVDVDPIVPPEAARFLKTAATDNFFILPTAGGGSTYKIPIGVTTVSNVDRQIQLTYTSSTGAAAGAQYVAPATLTIKAGSAVDTLTIQGLYNGYTSTRKDSLKITITSGAVKANAYNNTFSLAIRKSCPVVIGDLVGNYNNTNEYTSAGAFSYGPYSTALSGTVVINSTSFSGKLSNLYDDGWVDINATFDYSNADPTKWTVTIAKQATGNTSGGNPLYVRSTVGGPNTFSSCDNSISLAIDLLAGATGTTVLTTNYRIVLRK